MQQGKTYVTFVVDRSQSMSRLGADVKRTFDALARDIREQSKNLDTRVSLFMFNDRVEERFIDANAQNLWSLNDYSPQGNTALRDAIGNAIASSSKMHDARASHVSHMVMILTDGEENSSRYTSEEKVRQLIREKQNLGNWTFVFQVPPGAGYRISRDYDVSQGNIREWEGTRQGLGETMAATSSSFMGYFDDRSKGIRSVQSFYARPDLSNLKASQVKQQLNDISQRFSIHTVPSEQPIKDFVEDVTARPYQVGSTFYQLTKPEQVQIGKQVLLMEKGKRAVWGGTEARDLIGLPYGPVKVEPGNHANYDIFVQSTSTNRKLVRGTRILVSR